MFGRNSILIAAAFAGIAVLLALSQSKQSGQDQPYSVQGVNNTVLFLSNADYGLANILYATSYAVLVHHPEIQVHYASFSKRKEDIATISSLARKKTPNANPITFHTLDGLSYVDAVFARGCFIANLSHPPGVDGSMQAWEEVDRWLSPWTGSEYFFLYKQMLDVIDKVDPAIIAVDPMFTPGIDAIKGRNRKHAVISPNSLVDIVAPYQPWAGMLWKYPTIASGLPYPVPWRMLPANIYMKIRLIYKILFSPALKAKVNDLVERGTIKPFDFTANYNEHMTWISQSAPEADYPVSVIPENFKACGPIYLFTAPAEEQDPELASWIAQAPTVLINLGSATDYDEESATQMAGAVAKLLQNTNVQVLWKFNRRKYESSYAEFSNDFLGPLKEELGSRLRLEKWLNIDPPAMLKTGNIVASVHHGGAGCYSEALAHGVPQIVLPMWFDLYDYAGRVEWLGVGVWANKATAPYWKTDELASALLTVVGDHAGAAAMRKKAQELGEVFQRNPGDICAANEIAKLAHVSLSPS